MRRIQTVILAVSVFLLAHGSVWAGILLPTTDDPANIHINGPGGFTQSSGGTDWVTLPTFNGTFNITDVSDNMVTISPWNLVIAIPNVTGPISDLITKIGTTSVSISPLSETTLTAGSAYDALGLSGAPGSLSFSNFVLADQAVTGITPTSYGLYVFPVNLASLALISKISEDVTIGGNLPAGTILFAYGTGDDSKLYTTAFTNAGVVTPQAAPTPEPSTLAVAATGTLALLVYGLWRKVKENRRVMLQ